MIKLAPSLLAADFSRLGEEIKIIEEAGADYLHLDVMDGHFVPNLTFGSGLVKDLRPHSNLFFDVHLMIENPDQFAEAFVVAGADLLCVHQETCPHLHRTIQNIKELGVKAAVSLNPASSLCGIEEILPELDMVLLMSVNPGFGGQKFIPSVLKKIESLHKMIRERELDIDIQVDGGICLSNVGDVVTAGANVLVAGSAVFGAPDIKKAVIDLKEAAEKSYQAYWQEELKKVVQPLGES
ncbi:ribulose-phosphate 3-epimerase [Dehalobacterium formicoaceticum]|uniref:ribulose-phosphate 3-epimerase n=1 Tax=Dehalobacterium formicoaceticum TaxID=51515 RepID=UPI000B7C9AA5|nr:ribulose-phosphate 3-epimerase [Dehalobacterium formicoaceticum]